MNLEKNIDKNLVTYTVTLEPEEYKKYKYQAYLNRRSDFITENELRPSYEEIISNLPVDNFFDENIVKQAENHIYKEIEDETDTVVVEPLITEVKRDEDNIVVTILALNEPTIEIADYKNILTRPAEDFEVSEDELNDEINRIIKTNARLEPTEEALKEGHQANVDINIYKASNDERPVSSSPNVTLDFDVENMPYLVSEFNDFIVNELLGSSVGDVLVFPLSSDFNINDINSTNIDNADYVLELAVNQIYEPEYPELDEEFVSEVSEFETVDEFKNDLIERLSEIKEKSYWDQVDRNNMNAIFEQTTIDIPEEYVVVTENNAQNQYTSYLYHQNPDPFLIYMGEKEYFRSLVNEELAFRIINQLAQEEELEIAEEELEALKEKLNTVSVKDKYLGYDLDFLQQTFEDFPRLSERDIEEFYNYMLLRDKIKNKLREYTTIEEDTTEEEVLD